MHSSIVIVLAVATVVSYSTRTRLPLTTLCCLRGGLLSPIETPVVRGKLTLYSRLINIY